MFWATGISTNFHSGVADWRNTEGFLTAVQIPGSLAGQSQLRGFTYSQHGEKILIQDARHDQTQTSALIAPWCRTSSQVLVISVDHIPALH